MSSERPLLRVDHLQVRYDAIAALRDISFKVFPGQVVTLIGANGAGKSTTLNAISGIARAYSGAIVFDDTTITAWNPARIARFGLVQVPEGRQVIAPMTAQENLEMGQLVAQPPFWKTWGTSRHEQHRALEAIYDRFPRLGERRHQKAGSLSGGEQQMLALGRALLAGPRLLMLDEPSMGLAPLLVNEVFAIINDIKSSGETILIVEQNARKALEVADYAYVLERGRIVKQGPARDLRADDAIIEAYLG